MCIGKYFMWQLTFLCFSDAEEIGRSGASLLDGDSVGTIVGARVLA